MVVENAPGGRRILILGTDGTNLYGVLVDGAGRLQVDLVNLDDIGDIATQTTLAALNVLIGAVSNPASGTVNKHLADIQTRLGSYSSPLGGTVNYQLNEIDDRLDAIQVTRGDLASVERTGALATGATWTEIANVTGKGVVVGADFASNYGATEYYLQVDGDALYIPDRAGSWSTNLSPDGLNLLGGKTTWYEEGLYDDVNDYYSMFLKREIQYGTSFLLQCRQESGSAKNVLGRIYYRPIT